MRESDEQKFIEEREVLEVIAEKYKDMFSAEQKIADYILANPQEAVNCNVAELATASGVSDATVVRMCKHMGYSGYFQFRIALSRDLGKQQQMEETSVENEGAISRVFSEYAETMSAIGKRIDEESMRECINLLREADTVHIIAVGNTCNLSRYMGFRLERMGIRCTCDNVVEYYMNHINLSQKDDLLVAISKSGISKSVIRGMELAKERGLKTIAITAATRSPIAELADCVLVSSGKPEPFTIKKSYAYMNEFAVIEALLSFLRNKEMSKAIDADKPEIILSDYKM